MPASRETPQCHETAMTNTSTNTTQDQGLEEKGSAVRQRTFLFVVLHCDNPRLGGARYALSDVDLVLFKRGTERAAVRSSKNGKRPLEITFPSTTVSRNHGRLECRNGSWWLEDTESRNGCFINGQRVTSAELHDGDDVLVGDVLLRFRTSLRASSATNTDLESDAPPSSNPGFFTLLPGYQAQLSDLARIAQLPMATLLLGDSGTGKEVLARSIHTLSGRAGLFVAINCGALPQMLVESQLFGHVKGAFTGALRDELGFVRQADQGTLFLDEIGDLPLPAQAALLRMLQESEVIPVGGTRPVKVGVRVLAATHKRLDKMIARGEFRGDLWARLNGYRHELPPLAERIEDLGLLTREILARSEMPNAQSTRFGTQAARAMLHHPWPYNIRELAQALQVAMGLADTKNISRSHLPLDTRPPPLITHDDATTSPDALRQRLVSLLEKHHGNVSLVAKDMDKARTQVHRWLQRFAIKAEDFRE